MLMLLSYLFIVTIVCAFVWAGIENYKMEKAWKEWRKYIEGKEIRLTPDGKGYYYKET